MKPKRQIKSKLILVIVLVFSISLLLAMVTADNSPSETKEGRIIIDDPSQSGSFFIAADIAQNHVVSPILQTDFTFNALFAQWQYDSEPVEFDLYVKFLNETWSEWQKVTIDADYNGKDHSSNRPSSQMMPTKPTDSFQYKIAFESQEDKNGLKGLEFVYLNTTKGPSGSFKIASQASGLNIISRSQWGANENYKYDETGSDLWEETYYTPKKFVVHHTAGEKANQNPKATVRAIQHWHAVSRGWGDIGYNYLIDSFGNIYEGRKGGDGVVGGHAYMRNQNTIGIAILGCYDSVESNCNTPDNITQSTKNSLNRLIAAKSREFNIDPLGQSEFHGKNLNNVIGHTDVSSTICPGDGIYTQLQPTRQLAYNLLQDLGGYKASLPASAELVRQSAREIDIEETKTADIFVEFKNTGQAIWRGYEDAGLFLADSSVKNKLAQIGSVRLAMNKNYALDSNLVKYKLIDGNVYPGETGRFKLTLSSPTQKTVTKNLTLVWDNKGYFPATDFSITLNSIPCYSCQPKKIPTASQPTVAPIYSASIINSNFPGPIPANTLQDVTIQVKNTGNQPLSQDQLKLHIIYAGKHVSPFRNDSWYSIYAMIPPSQKTVYPNTTTTFEFKVKAPDVVFMAPHTLTLKNGDQVLAQIEKIIEVTSPYSAEISENTLPAAVLTSWRPKVKLTLTNTGSKTWSRPILKSYDIDHTNSWFRDWSWHDNKTIEKRWQDVTPGESITFEFKIKPYWKANTYPHVYKLFDGEDEIYINGKKEFLTYTRVDAP